MQISLATVNLKIQLLCRARAIRARILLNVALSGQKRAEWSATTNIKSKI